MPRIPRSMIILKEPKSIDLYTRAMCSWCADAKEWLDEYRWSYALHDTGQDSSAYKKAVQLSGQERVPVIEVDGFVLGDFDTNQLEDFLKTHGYLG